MSEDTTSEDILDNAADLVAKRLTKAVEFTKDILSVPGNEEIALRVYHLIVDQEEFLAEYVYIDDPEGGDAE